MIFKYEELIGYFQKIKEVGRTTTFSNWNNEKVFLIRHDVDFDISLAYELAKLEKKCGIVSTFFILTSSDCYNVLSAENKQYLREMIGMGHEVGLHFDPTIYGEEDLLAAVKFESSILSKVINKEVKSVSLHNPSIHGQFPLFENYINAYDPQMFSDKNYISDSCKNFRQKDPFYFLENLKEGMVQILLHPMHYSEGGDNYEVVVCKSLIRHVNKIHNIFSVNKKYQEEVGESIQTSLKKYL